MAFATRMRAMMRHEIAAADVGRWHERVDVGESANRADDDQGRAMHGA